MFPVVKTVNGNYRSVMRPVLKKRALVLHQSRKHAVLIAMHAAEQGQMMRTLKNVDRIHLNKAHLLDEALQGCRRGAALGVVQQSLRAQKHPSRQRSGNNGNMECGAFGRHTDSLP